MSPTRREMEALQAADGAEPGVDLTFLPPSVRRRATVDGWEVSWNVEDAADAIDALARHRHVVLSLDLLDVDDDGRYTATPWSVFEPDPDAGPEINVPAARMAAHAALAQVGPDHLRVLVTWE